MRMRIAGILGFALLGASPLAAQGRVEIGTQAGFTFRSSDEIQNEPTLYQFNIPGGGLLGRPTLWATIFVGRRIAFEPHLGYQFVRNDDLDTNTSNIGLSARGVWYRTDPRRASLYAFGDLSLDRSRELVSGPNDPSDTDFGLGGGAGYRWPVGDHMGVRTEGLYRFWVDDRRSEIAIVLGLGVVAKRR